MRKNNFELVGANVVKVELIDDNAKNRAKKILNEASKRKGRLKEELCDDGIKYVFTLEFESNANAVWFWSVKSAKH